MTLSAFCARVVRIFRRSLRKRGIWRTIPFLTYRLTLRIFGVRRPPGISEFDRIHGTDTSGEVMLNVLSIQSENVRFGIPYTPTPAGIFSEMIETLHISWPEFLFIDFGSGKGLPMLLASRFPFRKIIGIEFASELIRAAQENLERYRSRNERCPEFELVCMDVVDYSIPPEPAVLYFCNPFTRDVMRAVVGRIESSLRDHPRELWILYLNPVEHRIFERARFTQVLRNADYAIYHYLPVPTQRATGPCFVGS
jgi:hypothetical protein